MNNGVTRPGPVEPGSSRAPEPQCFQNSTLQAPQTITDGSAPSVFGRLLSIGAGGAVEAAPLLIFPWSPSSLVVDHVSYMLRGALYDGRKYSSFQDHHAKKFMMSSPDPRAYKRIGRGVHIFYYAIQDHVRDDAVLTGIFAKF